MIVLDSYSHKISEKRLTLYLDESLILMMTGPFLNDMKESIRYLYIGGLDYPMEILDNTDNYDKVIAVLEKRNECS